MVAEHNRVLNFPAAEFFYEVLTYVIEVVAQGGLILLKKSRSTTALGLVKLAQMGCSMLLWVSHSTCNQRIKLISTTK